MYKYKPLLQNYRKYLINYEVLIKEATIFMGKQERINSTILIIYIFAPSLAVWLKMFTDIRVLDFSQLFIYGILLILSILFTNFKFNKKFLAIFLILNIFFLINLLLVDYKDIVFDIYVHFFISAIFVLYLAFKPLDISHLLKTWYVVGILNIILWIPLLGHISNREISYMYFGNYMTLSFAIFLYYFLEKRKKTDFILLIISYLFIAILANRGAFLAINLLTFLYLFYRSRFKKTVGIITIFCGLFLYLINIKTIVISTLYNILYYLNELKISTLTVEKLIFVLEKGFLEGSTGRDKIYYSAIDLISESFMPKGVGYFQYITSIIYPHNFIIESLLIFGFLAIPLYLFLIIISIRFFMNEKSQQKKHVVFILLIIVIARLSLSSSFLIEVNFWVLLALMINIQSQSKNHLRISLKNYT